MKQEFMMLANTLTDKQAVAGFFVSEKLDGIRCFWDGGVSRGEFADEVPWCNSEKHGRYQERLLATGLWTRYGQPIQAPDWFVDALPEGLFLDGELWAGRGCFQKVTSAVRKLTPVDEEWDGIQYKVFDSPPMESIFRSREISITNMHKRIVHTACMAYCRDQHQLRGWDNAKWLSLCQRTLDFRDVAKVMPLVLGAYDPEIVSWHSQLKLPISEAQSRECLENHLAVIETGGGEGLMLRRPVSQWVPWRTGDLLKLKRCADMEVTVVGYTWGRETDKGSKLLGLMGAAVCELENGKRVEISGFSEAERVMTAIPGQYEKFEDTPIESVVRGVAITMQGKSVSEWIHNPMFPRGTRITIKYRELTDAGIPKEGRFFRA